MQHNFELNFQKWGWLELHNLVQKQKLCTEAFQWPCFYSVSPGMDCTCLLTMRRPSHYFLFCYFQILTTNLLTDALILASKCIILHFILLNFIPLTLAQCSKQSICFFCSFSILMMFHSLVTAPILALFSTKIWPINMFMCTQTHSYFTFYFFNMLVLLYCILPAIYFWKFLRYLTVLLILVFSPLNTVMAQLMLC